MPGSRAPQLRRLVALTAAILLLGSLAGPAFADDRHNDGDDDRDDDRNGAGFTTAQGAMLTGVSSQVDRIIPLLTVGDSLASGYRFEAIPDGISLRTRGHGRVDVYINHETSRVPFPYVAAAPTTANSQNDFDNAQLSRLILNQHSKGILNGRIAIASSRNFQRFCSNYLATEREGFDRPILFTNEETPDVVNRSGTSWPATAAFGSRPEQAGLVVGHDVRTGKTRPIYGMGRHNHENSVAIPGYDEVVVLSGDDTFTSDPAQSQLYAYIAEEADDVWRDEGALFGFKADNPAINDYYDFPAGSTMSVSGSFVEIPRAVAVGDQTGLEGTSDALGVFQFVRLEDIAYDKRPGMRNVIYIADTGRGATSPAANPFTSSNGRIWKLVLDPANPRRVLSLSIFVEGDDNPVKTVDEVHQPDNLETTRNGLYVTEDPASSQHFASDTEPGATTARVWRVALDGSSKEIVLKVNQAADEGATDKDPATTHGRLGSWEATGIVDASAAFGRGWFLVNVQAHSLFIEVGDGPDIVAPVGPDWLDKREGGQLLAIHIRGG